MCGRFFLTTPPKAIQLLFGFTGPLPNWPARYNIAPTQDVPIVRLARGERREKRRELAVVSWGLIPLWAAEASIGAKLINARSDGVAEKPSFRDAFRLRRCLIPADGFYEWQASGRNKRPYRIGLKAEGSEAPTLFAFAGLWERWEKSPDGVPVESCAIVTIDANELLRLVHHRMPVILHPHDYDAWLDPATPLAEALALLKPYPAEAMMIQPISTRVNNVRFDDPLCLAPEREPAAPPQPGLF